METSEFEKLVRKSLMEMPENIRKAMDNVAIVISQIPNKFELKQTGIRYGATLLGLYQGVPKTVWGRNFGMRLPDKITIFQRPIEMIAHTDEEIIELVKNTVWHEVAHHFGYDEKGIKQMEKKKKMVSTLF